MPAGEASFVEDVNEDNDLIFLSLNFETVF